LRLKPLKGFVRPFFHLSQSEGIIIEMEETAKQTRTYDLSFVQDFGSLPFSVEVKASSLEEAIELARDPENQPAWLLEAVSQASDLDIEADGCYYIGDDDYEGEEEEA
jgi:hypothetical protein